MTFWQTSRGTRTFSGLVLLLGLPLLLAALILVPVLADSPKEPTGKAPLEILVHRFRAPTGAAVDPDGTVFFTDREDGRIWQRAPNRSLTILVDRLEHPRGLVRGEDGTLFLVADGFRESKKGPEHKGVLLKRTLVEGTVTILADEFKHPQQLAFDANRNILLSTKGGLRHPPDQRKEDERDDEDDEDDEDDAEDKDEEAPPTGFRGTIFRISAEDGQILGSHSGFRRPSGVMGDEAGRLTVAAERVTQDGASLKGTLFQITTNGDVSVLLAERFRHPTGLVRDGLGFLFLAVKWDRDTPKDGGLILRVAPDGSVTRFAHGFQRPWGLTFDPQGNLYVTDPKAGTISRFLAPAAPTLPLLSESTTQASIEVSGAAEPEATITVRGGQEDTTTLADLEGKFTLDVPLVPNQVNALMVYATGAKGEGLTSAPATAPIQQQTGPPPPSITIVLQITNPAPGATVTADSVLVRGLVDAGGLEVGVSVNGLATNLSGTQWAVEIPVVLGSNTVAATATTVTGAQATASISVNVPQANSAPLLLRASPASGVAPLEVRWEVINQTGRPLVQFQLDETGTGAFGAPTATFEGVKTTYTGPGLRFPTLRAMDDQGTTHTVTTAVSVEDPQTVTARFQERWTSFKARLQTGDIPGALAHLAPNLQSRFQTAFQQLGPNLPTIAGRLGDVEVLEQMGDLAEAVILQQENGAPHLYFIYFRRDSLGRWLIEEM